jgi:hypothetical protein
MANLPRVRVSVSPTAAAPGGGTDVICVLAPVATQPDMQPRLYGSAAAIAAVHGYSEGVEYAANHFSGTGKQVLFTGMPIGTAGAISRSTSYANTGTSVVTVAAGSDGILAEHDGQIDVVAGGTIGTSQIRLNLSLDGGRTFQPIRLGTATSFAVPNVNATVSFAAGTLVTDDTILEWHGSAPRIDTSDLAEVRAALASGSQLFRDALICGDLPNEAAALVVVAQANAYATENDRHITIRASVPDRLPQASLSQSYARMTGNPALTFETATDTCTRDSGSWLSDGFRNGDTVNFTNTALNNVTLVVTTVTADVLDFAAGLADEVFTDGDAVVTGGPTLVFDATADTITRNRGSWLADGFRAGDSVTTDGSASNDVTLPAVTVTALVLTLANGLVNETILASSVTVTAGETKAEWMGRVDNEFADVDGTTSTRVNLSAGRGAFPSNYSGWLRRIPAGWLASVRSYAHDLHVPSWRKDIGPLGASLFDASEELVEWDDRVDGGAGSAARFTTLHTWANGPRGAFVAQDLTRAGDGQISSQHHNQAVINDACNTVQVATENVIGRTLILNTDGTATKGALAVIAAEVNAALELELLTSRGEGPRASSAVWTPNPADIYNVPEPLMTGTLVLVLNGTVHSVTTTVRIPVNGQ